MADKESEKKVDNLTYIDTSIYVEHIRPTLYDRFLPKAILGKWQLAESSKTPKKTVMRSILPISASEVAFRAEQFQRAHEWVTDNKIDEESARRDRGVFLETIPAVAAVQIVIALFEVYTERTLDKEKTIDAERVCKAWQNTLENYFVKTCDLNQEIIKFHGWLKLLISLDAIEHADALGGLDDEWQKNFQKRYKHVAEGTSFVGDTLNSYSGAIAHEFVNELDPANMPLEKLHNFLDGQSITKALENLNLNSFELLGNLSFDVARVFSMQPAQTIDRAARGHAGWEFPDNEAPVFKDQSNQHQITYYREGESLEKLHEGVQNLGPRDADCWRLITAKVLEMWPSNQAEPSAVWMDVPELLEGMGYKKKKRAFKPEDVLAAVQSLENLDSFHIVIPRGAKTFPLDPKTGKRKATKLQAQTRYKVLIVSATDELRDLWGNTYPMRWLIRPGEWIKAYPRMFARLYRALVELPAKRGVNTWAKSIGTELAYQYQQDRRGGPQKVLKVETLIQKAGLMHELVKDTRNRGRARDYFEKALDTLKDIGVCEKWEYDFEDIDALDLETGPGQKWFDTWLETRVRIQEPNWLSESLPKK